MMKKLFFAVIMASNFSFGQITLQHSFPVSEQVFAFTKGNEMIYVSKLGNQLKMYNSNFVLTKTVNVPVPANYILSFSYNENSTYSISKHIFNTDDLYEFVIVVTNNSLRKLMIVNENGILIKDFHPFSNYGEEWEIFHDTTSNTNKIIVEKWNGGNYLEPINEVYSLPTSVLALNDTQIINELSAFPIPTKNNITIINPQNGSNTVQIFDDLGKLVLSKSFSFSENRIEINVEHFEKGIYFCKIGNLNSKFIKN
jgi:hypothetical protein